MREKVKICLILCVRHNKWLTDWKNYLYSHTIANEREEEQERLELEEDQDYDLLSDMQQSSNEHLQQQGSGEEEDEEDDLLTTLPLSPLEKLIKFSNSTLVLQRYEKTLFF